MGTTGVLESIGALIIGGIFLVMIFNAYSNVNVMSHNINMQVTANQISESVSSLLGSVYLSKVGAGVDTSAVAITLAKKRRFKFLGKINPDDETDSEIFIYQSGYNETYGGYALRVKINGSVDAGPFWMSTKIVFKYYDVNENQFTYSELNNAANRDLVRSVRIQFELFQNPLSLDGQPAEIKQKMVFWKYFKNLYLGSS